MAKKVKKRRLKILPCLILVVILIFIYLIVEFLLDVKTMNIFIHGNNLLSDQEIIDLGGLSNYPSFLKTFPSSVEHRILKNPLVKSVDVKPKFFNVFDITVEEKEIIFYDNNSEKYVLSDGSKVELNDINGVPVLLNYIPDTVSNTFITRFALISPSIREHISEIKYEPSSYDSTRFLFYMSDGNYVYINNSSLDSIKYYDTIYPNLDGKKGILYLDSGYGEASQFKILEK